MCWSTHPGLGLTHVYPASFPTLTFEPTVHLNYADTALWLHVDNLAQGAGRPLAAGKRRELGAVDRARLSDARTFCRARAWRRNADRPDDAARRLVCRTHQTVVQSAELGLRARLDPALPGYRDRRLADLATWLTRRPHDGLVPSAWAEFYLVAVFFGAHRIGLALAIIVALLAAILSFIVTAWPRDHVASWLFVPYAAGGLAPLNDAGIQLTTRPGTHCRFSPRRRDSFASA